MKNISVIILFLIVKIFQWINSLVLTKFFSFNETLPLMIGILFFATTMFIFGLLAKKILYNQIPAVLIGILLFLFIISSNLSWLFTFLASVALYFLIGAEAQVFQLFSSNRKIPRFIPLFLSFLPIVISFPFFQSDGISSQFFYIISSIFAFFVSYSKQISGGKNVIVFQEGIPIWFGLFFIIASNLLYYFFVYKATETPSDLIFLSVLYFYVGGAIIIYLPIIERLKKIIKKND